MSYITSTLSNLLEQTAFFNLTWGNYVMIVVALIFCIWQLNTILNRCC